MKKILRKEGQFLSFAAIFTQQWNVNSNPMMMQLRDLRIPEQTVICLNPVSFSYSRNWDCLQSKQ